MDEYFPEQRGHFKTYKGKEYLINFILKYRMVELNDTLKDLRYNENKKSLINEIIEVIKKNSNELFKKLESFHNLNHYIPRNYNNEQMLKFHIELIENLIYFNIFNDEQIKMIYEIIEEFLNYHQSLLESVSRIKAGRKIAKFIKENLDDEFEMKPMRSKIDMSKIERDL